MVGRAISPTVWIFSTLKGLDKSARGGIRHPGYGCIQTCFTLRGLHMKSFSVNCPLSTHREAMQHFLFTIHYSLHWRTRFFAFRFMNLERLSGKRSTPFTHQGDRIAWASKDTDFAHYAASGMKAQRPVFLIDGNRFSGTS